MYSPIARRLLAAARWVEEKHRQRHGPEYAPGDVVEVRLIGPMTLLRQGRHLWTAQDDESEEQVHPSQITRVVRYGDE